MFLTAYATEHIGYPTDPSTPVNYVARWSSPRPVLQLLMATPSHSRHQLAGTLGDILVDVRAAARAHPRPAVVVVHGFKGFKDWGMFPVFADRLARAGFTAVSFNMSGSGVDDAGEFTRPDRFRRNTYSAELADLETVIGALAGGALGTVAPTSIGLVGHSRGGGVAVLQTARDPRIRGLTTWAAIAAAQRWSPADRAAWRERGHADIVNTRTGQVLALGSEILDDIDLAGPALDIEAAAGRVSVPWLIVHGSDDESVPVAEANRLAAASRRETTRLLIVDRAGHAFGGGHPWKPPVPAAEGVFDATVAFLAASLA